MKIEARTGNVLYNKKQGVYARIVHIGTSDNPDNWVEIPESEAKNVEEKTGIEGMKEDKIAEIVQADKKASVFYVNGIGMWIDKELRNSLLNVTLPALRAAGATTTELWYEGIPPVPITVPIDLLLQLIPQLELFAKSIYDNTNRLKAVVYTCETEEELNEFKITGYPEPLKFEL